MNQQKFIEGIGQTGFPLENQTVEKLVAARWSIISNKYYLDTDDPQPREIDILAYKVADVQGVEVVNTFSRVTFVRASAFEQLLEDYGRLHTANKRIVGELIHDFFHLILTDSANYSKRATLMKQFRETLRNEILFFVLDWDDDIKWDDAWLSWSDKKKLIEIHVPAPREAINYMNAEQSVQRDTAKVLRSVYRYEGAFEFA